MAKEKMVKSHDVWNSGGGVYVVSGELNDGKGFLASFGNEFVISLYETEQAVEDSWDDWTQGFIRYIAPRNPISKQIYGEIFDAEIRKKGKEWWFYRLVESTMQEYDDVMHNEELLNELDEWEKEVRS